MSIEEARKWAQYDYAAEWCAKRGLSGKTGTTLPTLLANDVLAEINDHPDEFIERVKATAYALAMSKHSQGATP